MNTATQMKEHFFAAFGQTKGIVDPGKFLITTTETLKAFDHIPHKEVFVLDMDKGFGVVQIAKDKSWVLIGNWESHAFFETAADTAEFTNLMTTVRQWLPELANRLNEKIAEAVAQIPIH